MQTCMRSRTKERSSRTGAPAGRPIRTGWPPRPGIRFRKEGLMSAVANRNSDVVLPLRPTPVAPFGELALVADISEAGLIVEFGSARLPARVALSCLIQ